MGLAEPFWRSRILLIRVFPSLVRCGHNHRWYEQDRRQREGQWCPAPPFHVWPTGCCIYPILYFKSVAPLLVFGPSFWFLAPPAAKFWRRAWVRAVGSSRSSSPRVLSFRTSWRPDWKYAHSLFVKEDTQENAYEKLKENDFIQNY